MLGFIAILVAFLVWELSAAFRRWTHVSHRTLSEYVWQWVGKDKHRRYGVLVLVSGFGLDLASHLAFGTPLTGIIAGW